MCFVRVMSLMRDTSMGAMKAPSLSAWLEADCVFANMWFHSSFIVPCIAVSLVRVGSHDRVWITKTNPLLHGKPRCMELQIKHGTTLLQK